VNQPTALGLDKGCSVGALTLPARKVHLAVMAAFAGSGRAAYPFSPVTTAIQVRWAGGPLTYAMCAVDALGISAMLGRPVTITAAEPGTGRIITVHAHRDQARWDPRHAVVFAGEAGEQGCLSVDRTCGYINFFTSARAARAWVGHRPDVTGTVLSQAQALREGVAEFGAYLQTSDGTTPP
jgi:hypothetical protein